MVAGIQCEPHPLADAPQDPEQARMSATDGSGRSDSARVEWQTLSGQPEGRRRQMMKLGAILCARLVLGMGSTAEGKSRISGKVVDEDGKAVNGVTVRLRED